MPKIIVFKLLTPIDYTESTENTFTYVIKMSNSKEDELVLLYIDKDAKQQLKKFRLASLIERYENIFFQNIKTVVNILSEFQSFSYFKQTTLNSKRTNIHCIQYFRTA